RDAAVALGLGDDVEAYRGLARALGPEHLDDAPAWDPPHAQRDVERERPRRDDRDAGAHRVLAELHHRALAELLLDLRERDVEHLVPVVHPRSLLRVLRPPRDRVGELLVEGGPHATAWV